MGLFNLNKFTHKLDELVSQLTLVELLKFNDRLIDTYDHDCYLASQELNELTFRGSERLDRSDWEKIILKHILSHTVTEDDYIKAGLPI